MAARSSSASAETKPSFKPNPGQVKATSLLAGPQRHTLLVGGSRSGKTFWLVRAVIIRALRAAHSRHVILRFRGNAAETAIGMDTFPKVMRTCFPEVPYKTAKQPWYFTLPNGAEIWLGGLDDKERVEKILGNEFATIYFNECSQIPYSSVLVALTRLAQTVEGLKQRAYYDLNPTGTGHWTHRLFIDHRDPETGRQLTNPDDYHWLYLNPAQNAENLSPEYLASLAALPERQRKRFLEGVYSAEVDGALWTIEVLEQCRVETAPELRRIVVAIDPSGTSGQDDKRSDHVGIVVAGLGVDGHGYVLEDLTCQLPPEGWGRRAVEAYHRWRADRIVAEKNFGGDMVGFVIRTADQNASFKLVNAAHGKAVRAEPVSALYGEVDAAGALQRCRVHHVGDPAQFRQIEDQMLNFSTSGYQGSKSPDRADALVWALTELMVEQGNTGLLDYYREEAAKLVEKRGANANPAPEEMVRLIAPAGVSTVYTITGRAVLVGEDGTVVVSEGEAGPLMGAGFRRHEEMADG